MVRSGLSKEVTFPVGGGTSNPWEAGENPQEVTSRIKAGGEGEGARREGS